LCCEKKKRSFGEGEEKGESKDGERWKGMEKREDARIKRVRGEGRDPGIGKRR